MAPVCPEPQFQPTPQRPSTRFRFGCCLQLPLPDPLRWCFSPLTPAARHHSTLHSQEATPVVERRYFPRPRRSQFVQYELAWGSFFCPLPSRRRNPLACPLCFLPCRELCVLGRLLPITLSVSRHSRLHANRADLTHFPPTTSLLRHCPGVTSLRRARTTSRTPLSKSPFLLASPSALFL